MSGARWGLSALIAVVAKIILIAGAFLFVAIYSHGVNPGESHAFYQDFAQRFVPFFALIAGLPLFFGAGRWLAARDASVAAPTALAAWLIHTLLDLPVLLVDGAITPSKIGICMVSWALFLAAIWLGARRPTAAA